jgi:hypothetical protein
VQDEPTITTSGILTILMLLPRASDKRTILQLEEETKASDRKWRWYSDWISVCYVQSNETPLALIKIFGNQNNSSESTDSEPISAENQTGFQYVVSNQMKDLRL